MDTMFLGQTVYKIWFENFKLDVLTIININYLFEIVWFHLNISSIS